MFLDGQRRLECGAYKCHFAQGVERHSPAQAATEHFWSAGNVHGMDFDAVQKSSDFEIK